MSAQEFKDMGNKAFQNKQYEEAIEHYSNAIALEDNHVFYSNRSGAYLAINRFGEALEDADACIKIQPTFAKGFARRAAVLQAVNQLPEALDAYQQASKLDAANQSYKDEIVTIQRRLSPPPQHQQPPPPPGGAFNLFGPDMMAKLDANPQTRQLAAQPAIRAALQDIEKNPQNMANHMQNPGVMMCLQSLLGITPEMQMKSAMEEEELEKKRKQAEEDRLTRPVATPSMARDTTKVDDLNKQEEEEVEVDEELEREKRERKENREKADKVKEEGAKLYKARDFEGAIVKFKEAFEIDDSNPVYYMNIAAAEFELQRYEECIETCKLALGVYPISPQQKGKCHARIANALQKQKKYPEAIAAYKKSVLEDNQQAVRQALRQAEQDYRVWLVESYYDDEKSELAKEDGNKAYGAGDYAKAIDFYTDAIKRNPKNYKVYSNRALCYTKVCAWEKALEDCDKCLSFDPKFVKAMLRKGKVLHFLKSYHKAMEVFRAGLEIEPNDQELLDAIQATQRAIYSTHDNSPGGDEARLAEAMKDPEVMLAFQNPKIQKLLQDMQNDPQVAMAAFQDPQVAPLLEKLIAAGIIKLG